MWQRTLTVGGLVGVSLWFLTCSQGKQQRSAPQQFGKTSEGTEVTMFTIKNAKGLTAEIINYGAIVTRLMVADRNGKIDDVVLGFADEPGYEKDNTFQGAIVGRYGNRIAQGKFLLDGKAYQLTVNSGENHLHGGFNGFYRKVWNVEYYDEHSVKLSIVSPDGEEGYPGQVRLEVTYTVTDSGELKIEYRGTTDQPTILNPTSHCYFNLSGSPVNNILDHELMLNAEYFTAVDDKMIPTGELRKVEGTPLDFRTAKPVGRDIAAAHEQLRIGMGYDHNWVINGHPGELRLAAVLYHPGSGRLMEVLTDQAGVQFYSGNFLDGSLIGKGGVRLNYRTALCLEAQAFPDSPNKANFPSVILRPGEEYHQTTIYRFSVK